MSIMITPGQEQHLGHKVLFLLSLKRIFFGIILIFFALVLAFSGNYLSGLIGKIIASSGIASSQASGMSSEILMYINLIVFWLGVLICLVGILIAYLEYINYSYRFDEFDLIMKKGILDKVQTSVPYRQIQDVDIERPLSYQLLGLSRLVIKTAGTDEKNENDMTEIAIEPINKSDAEEIQNMLERKIGVQIMETDNKADKEENAETSTESAK